MPDTPQADFVEECRRQSKCAALADAADPDLDLLLDAALADVEDED
ncbi:antitoxin MazE-like protein [Neorhizobium sp. NCHU2750]